MSTSLYMHNFSLCNEQENEEKVINVCDTMSHLSNRCKAEAAPNPDSPGRHRTTC
jgi:hypothetical protein